MQNQYWYCVHAKEDMTQKIEEDHRLRSFLTKHQVNLAKSDKTLNLSLLELAGRCFNGYKGERSTLFFRLNYNHYTRLPRTPKLYFGLYGIRGLHRFTGRPTSYTNFYISEDTALLGTSFFDYIFGSYYLTEQEARVESVKQLLDTKTEKQAGNMELHISEKDRLLVCRIVERLWSCQLEKAATRFVICMNDREIQERSMELLKQVYMLLPQQLRLNMGFCTCSTLEDLKTLTEEYGVPVHVFTMSAEEAKKVKAESLKNPIEFFDIEDMERQPYDTKRLQLLLELSKKITPSSDAKIACAEKSIVKGTMGNLVSFKNMQNILTEVNKEGFCWWERNDLDRIEDVQQLYTDQKEMMQMDVLRQEALHTFYTKLLPWKDYAKQIANVVVEDNYPNRQEILDFFSDELKLAKVVEAMQGMKEQAARHERQALDAAHASWRADMARKQAEYEAAISQKEDECFVLMHEKHEMEREAQKYKAQLNQREEDFASERAVKEEKLKELGEQARKYQRELEEVKKKLEEGKPDLNKEEYGNKGTAGKHENVHTSEGQKRELEILEEKLREKKNEEEQLHEEIDIMTQKKNRFMIISIISESVAVILLVVAVIFALKSSKSGQIVQEKDRMESEMTVLESEKEGWQLAKEGLESQVSSLEDRNAALESEKKELESAMSKAETEAETEADEIAVEKALIVYYTYATGSTKAVVEEIQKQTGADIFKIKTVEKYPEDYDSIMQRMKDDWNQGVDSHLANSIDNWDEYDTVFLGFPVWGNTMPRAISAFAEAYDLTGKTVVPFFTVDATECSGIEDQFPDVNFLDTLIIPDKHIDDENVGGGVSTEGSESESQESEAEEPEDAEENEQEDSSEFSEEVSEWLKKVGVLQQN